RGAAIPGFAGPPNDFLQGQRVSVWRSGAATEAAETAAHETDVGEIDIAIHDVGDGIADDFAAQTVSSGDESLQGRMFRIGQDETLFERQLRTARRSVEDFGNFGGTSVISRQSASVNHGRGHFLCIAPEETNRGEVSVCA